MLERSGVRLLDVSGQSWPEPDHWPPVVITRASLEREAERLADLARPDNGRRASMIVHPKSTTPGLGLTPGTDVTLNVLLPGESTRPMRRNSSQIEVGVRGAGQVFCGGEAFAVGVRDVWNLPSMQTHARRNAGAEPLVWLSYSNAPLLEKLEIHYVEDNPATVDPVDLPAPAAQANDRRGRESAPDLKIGDAGARLRGYEWVVDIEVLTSRALLWPWAQVKPTLRLALDQTEKRTIMLMYNPATERRNGTTHSYFATWASIPPGLPDPVPGRGHRHSSAAINYHVEGSGRSIVGDQQIEWAAGDLVLSAPGWAEHAHYPSGAAGTVVMTVQDHPLQIGMESLIWQEDMGGAILALGSEEGVTGFTGPRERAG